MSRKTIDFSTIFRAGIRRSLVLWGLGLFGLVLVGTTLIGDVYMRRQIQRSSGMMQKEVASLTARHVHAYIGLKTQRLSDTATNLSLHSLGGQEQRIIITILVKDDQSFQEISVVDDKGLERLRVSDLKVYFDTDLRNLKDNPGFLTAIKGADYVSSVYTSDKAEPYIFLAVPVTNPTKTSVEVVMAKTSMKFLWDLVRQETFGRAGVIYIVNETGHLIAHKDPLQVLENPNLQNVPAVAEFLRTRSKMEAPAMRGLGLSGAEVLTTFSVVPDLGWAVIVEEPVGFALEDVEALEKFTGMLLIAGLLVGFILIVILSNRLTKPILKLREGAIIIGTGNLDHRVSIERKDEIGELAANFNQMADTIKKSQDLLETRVQLRTRELSVLYGVSTQTNQSLDVASVLKYGIDQIEELFHFDAIRVFLFDDLFETLSLAASNDTTPGQIDGVGPFGRGESLVGRVAESGEPAIFKDIQLDPQYSTWSESKTAHRAGFRFLAALPVKTKTQIFGVAVFTSKQSQDLADDNTKLLNAICEQLAVAVEKSRLFKEITKRSEALEQANVVLENEVIERQRAEEAVLRHSKRMELLHELNSALSSTLDRQVSIDLLFTKMAEILPYSATTLRLFNKTTGQLESAATRNLDGEDYSQVPNGGISRLVFDQKRFLIVDNLQTDPRVYNPEVWRKHGLISYIGVPLISENTILGVLGFYMNAPHKFPKEEIEFLATLASQVAIAIYNSELYERTRRQAEDLKEANRAKDEFLNVMSHELRTPLNVVMGYAQVLDEGILGDISVEQRHAVKTIIFQSRELLRMINEVLQVGSLQAGKVTVDFEDTDLGELFKELVNTCGVLSKKTIALLWEIPPDLPIVKTDGDKLKHILQNLISNAIKFTDEGSVTVSARCLPAEIEFKVTDTGVGITEDMLPVIFEMFRQVDSSKTRSYGGAGVGLFIVNRFVELLRGTIKVSSDPGKGTTFTVTIPAHTTSKMPIETASEVPPVSIMAL